MVTMSLANLLRLAPGVLDTLNANWPRWVGNLANIAQIGGGLAAVVAFLSGRLSAIRRSRGSAHRADAPPGSCDGCAASCLGSGGLPQPARRRPLAGPE